MLEQLAWGFCRMAFDASRDECFPDPMRRTFQCFGTIWLWLALSLEGRALASLCECDRQPGSRWFLPLLWAHRTLCHHSRQLGRLVASVRQSKDAAPGVSDTLPQVVAWSLPPVAHIQRLGLGRVWVVDCPFCSTFHTHLPGEGCRQAACRFDPLPGRYCVAYAGELPAALHERFRASVGGIWPKLLLEWSQSEAPPSLLRAA